MEESKHLHTHAHKTQTYWPSQANNKLIWAISALCGGTKQQDQTGAAASSPEMRPASPALFSYPCCLTLLARGRVDTRKRVSGAGSSLHLWHSAQNWADTQVRDGKMFVLLQKKTVSCPRVLHTMNNNSVVWHGFHGYNPPTLRPWQTSPPTSSLSL